MKQQIITIVLFFAVVFTLVGVYATVEKARADCPTMSQPQMQTRDTKVVAYYFHVNFRCTTCRAIERYSREVIERKFGTDIAKARLQFQLVNLELAENRHFCEGLSTLHEIAGTGPLR